MVLLVFPWPSPRWVINVIIIISIDVTRRTSTKRNCFWFGGLLALVLWCLDYTAFQTLACRSVQRDIKMKPTIKKEEAHNTMEPVAYYCAAMSTEDFEQDGQHIV